MNKKEAAQVLAILKAAYPSSYKNLTREEASGTVAVWYIQFADMPADVVMMAVHKLIAKSKFPPTVAEVKDQIANLHWEAYGAMSDAQRYGTASETEIEKYRRIYRLTEGYGAGNGREPGIRQIAAGESRIMIENGG